jgi:hypothetical protein
MITCLTASVGSELTVADLRVEIRLSTSSWSEQENAKVLKLTDQNENEIASGFGKIAYFRKDFGDKLGALAEEFAQQILGVDFNQETGLIAMRHSNGQFLSQRLAKRCFPSS